MEPLPRGANFQRCKLMWEIGSKVRDFWTVNALTK